MRQKGGLKGSSRSIRGDAVRNDLAAGMKQKVPGITVGQDYYCVGVNQNPSWTCARKLVAATTNS